MPNPSATVTTLLQRPAAAKSRISEYFIVMIDYGRQGREAIVNPEETRRDVIDRLVQGDYPAEVLWIHRIDAADGHVSDVTLELQLEASVMAEAA